MRRTATRFAASVILWSAIISSARCHSPPSPEPRLSVSQMDETALFTYDEASVGCYRIPIMMRTVKGTIIVAVEGRKLKRLRWTCDDAGPKFIAIRRSADDGVTWQPMQFVVNDPDVNLGTIFEDETNHTVFIQFVRGFFRQPNTIALIASHDEGRTWGSPRNISHQLGTFAFIGGPGYGLTKKYPPHKGRMLFCGHSAIPTDGVYCIYSDDRGTSWHWGAEMPAIPYSKWKKRGDFNPDECQPYEMPDGSIVVSARNQNIYHCACRLQLVSKDGGDSFSHRDVTIIEDLPDVVVQASALFQDDVIFASNPYHLSPGYRINMTLSWSTDYGKSYGHHFPVWSGGSGYSCLTSIRPLDTMGFGVLGLVFEKGPDKNTYWHTVTFVRLAYIKI